MSIVDSITKARAQGASDDQILAQISAQNPTKASSFTSAQSQGANASQILDEVVKQNSTTAPTTSSGGFLKSLVSAPATIIARPLQAVAELAGASSQAVDAFSSKYSGGLVAPVPQNASDVKKDVGRGIETVALGAGGPVSGGAALGLGSSLEQGNDLLSVKTAFDTALGAVGGKVLDTIGKPIFNAAGNIIGKVTPLTLKDIAAKGVVAMQEFAAAHDILPENVAGLINTGAKTAEELANKPFQAGATAAKKAGTAAVDLYNHEYPTVTPTQMEVEKAQTNIAKQYEKVLPLTPTQKVKEAQLLDRTGDNVYTTLAKNGVNLGSDEATQQLQSLSEQFSQATKFAQKNEQGYFNVDEIRANAYKAIDQNLASETERKAAKSKLDDEIDSLLQSNSGQVHPSSSGDRLIKSDLVERLRKTGNDWAQYNKLNPDSVKNAVGRGLGDAVRDQVEKQGTFPAYREANREWGKIIHAQEVTQTLENSGKKFNVAGGLSGAVARRVLSGVFGYHTAGVGGAILGEIGMDYAAQILSNPELRTYFDRQIVNKFTGENPTPEIVSKLTQQVKDYIDNQAKVPRLPAPQSIQLGPKTPNPSGVEFVPAKKNPVSANPKTGKFQTSYSSTP